MKLFPERCNDNKHRIKQTKRTKKTNTSLRRVSNKNHNFNRLTENKRLNTTDTNAHTIGYSF